MTVLQFNHIHAPSKPCTIESSKQNANPAPQAHPISPINPLPRLPHGLHRILLPRPPEMTQLQFPNLSKDTHHFTILSTHSALQLPRLETPTKTPPQTSHISTPETPPSASHTATASPETPSAPHPPHPASEPAQPSSASPIPEPSHRAPRKKPERYKCRPNAAKQQRGPLKDGFGFRMDSLVHEQQGAHSRGAPREIAPHVCVENGVPCEMNESLPHWVEGVELGTLEGVEEDVTADFYRQ